MGEGRFKVFTGHPDHAPTTPASRGARTAQGERGSGSGVGVARSGIPLAFRAGAQDRCTTSLRSSPRAHLR